MQIRTHGPAQFAAWLQANHPQLFNMALNRVYATQGLADDTASTPVDTTTQSVPWYQSILDNASKLLGAYGTYQQQQNLIKLNIARAQQGLGPLDMSAAAAQVNVGLAPDTKTLVYVGLGLAMLMFFASKKRA